MHERKPLIVRVSDTDYYFILGDRPMPRIGERIESPSDVMGYIRMITWMDLGDGSWEAMLFLTDDPPGSR